MPVGKTRFSPGWIGCRRARPVIGESACGVALLVRAGTAFDDFAPDSHEPGSAGASLTVEPVPARYGQPCALMKFLRVGATALVLAPLVLGGTAAEQSATTEQNEPTRRHVEVVVKSDGKTWISFEKAEVPWTWSRPTPQQGQQLTYMLPPGDYVLLGRRKTYRDVRVAIRVREEAPFPSVRVVCTEKSE